MRHGRSCKRQGCCTIRNAALRGVQDDYNTFRAQTQPPQREEEGQARIRRQRTHPGFGSLLGSFAGGRPDDIAEIRAAGGATQRQAYAVHAKRHSAAWATPCDALYYHSGKQQCISGVHYRAGWHAVSEPAYKQQDHTQKSRGERRDKPRFEIETRALHMRKSRSHRRSDSSSLCPASK